MRDYTAETYGAWNASVFDRIVELIGVPPPDAVVERLKELAHGGAALELGVGTGRVAIPLAAAGVDVTAIEISQEMIDRLESKPGSESVRVVKGDFADACSGSTFSVIYAVGHTFFSLLTQDEQVRCFENVAKCLALHGVFVIETWIPDPGQIAARTLINPVVVTPDTLVLAIKYYDRARQLLIGHHLEFHNGKTAIYPEVVRYAAPTELDLMARIAGLRVRERHAGWNGEPFTAQSQFHVSVYELAPNQ